MSHPDDLMAAADHTRVKSSEPRNAAQKPDPARPLRSTPTGPGLAGVVRDTDKHLLANAQQG